MSTYASLRGNTVGGRLRFLLGDSVLYGGAVAVNKLLTLFTVPLLTRVLSPKDFGAMDALAVFGSVVVLALTMGQDTAVARYFYETEDVDVRRSLISQALAAQLVLTLLATVPLLLFARDVASAVGTPGFGQAASLLALSLPFTILLQFCRNLLKWTFARSGFILLSVGSTVAIVSATVVLVVFFDAGVNGVFGGLLIGNVLFAVVGVFLCRGWLIVPTTFHWLRSLLAFGWPYMLVAVGSAALPALDRYFVSNKIGLEAMASYAVGYKYASLIALPVMAFQTAWGPFSLAIYREADVKQTYDRALALYVSVIAAIVFCMVVVAEPAISLFASERYRHSSIIVLPLALGLLLESTGWITGVGIDLSKRTDRALISYCLGLVVAAAAILLIGSRHGIVGVAWGVFAGRVTQAAAYTLFGQQVYPLKLSWHRPAIVIVLVAGLALLGRAVDFERVAGDVVFRGGLGLCVALTVWYVGLSREERLSIGRRVLVPLGRVFR